MEKSLTKSQQTSRYQQIRSVATKLRRRQKQRTFSQFRDLYQSIYDSREYIELY